MQPQRAMAAVVASLVSQSLLILLLLLFPPITPPPPLPSHPLLLHLLSSSQLAASSLLLLRHRKKRKRSEDEPAVIISLPLRPSPDPFKLSFRMSSSTFEFLSGLLEPLLDCRDPAGQPPLLLPGPTRLAVALSRLALGTPYPDLARRFSLSEPAARFLAKHLCRVLCTNFRFYLSFPSASASAGTPFPGGLQGCRGALACARFACPGGGAAAAQLVADADSRILSLAAGFRGQRSDSYVLRCSSLYKDVQEGRIKLGGGSGYLVGDGGGYPLLPWLMVPFATPAIGSVEEEFNVVHGMMSRPVRRAVCSLRNWGVLDKLVEEEDGKVAVACIGTCAILHNVLLMREDYSALASDVMEEERFGSLEKYGEGGVAGLEEDWSVEEEAIAVQRMLAERARAMRNASSS